MVMNMPINIPTNIGERQRWSVGVRSSGIISDQRHALGLIQREPEIRFDPMRPCSGYLDK